MKFGVTTLKYLFNCSTTTVLNLSILVGMAYFLGTGIAILIYCNDNLCSSARGKARWSCSTKLGNVSADRLWRVLIYSIAYTEDSRLLSGDSFYAVLGKKDGDCPGLPKDNRQCYGAVCYCNVECIVPCLNASSTAAADYYFTWTVTDEGLQLKNERLETVAHNLLGDTGEKRRFEASVSLVVMTL